MPVFQLLVYPIASGAMDTASYEEARDAKPLYSALMAWFFSHITDVADLRDPVIKKAAEAQDEAARAPTQNP